MIENLNKINKVIINDFRECKTGLSNNGGCYGYFTVYNRITDKTFAISYYTTADLEYCPVCGNFGSHLECDEEIGEYYTCGDFDCITEEALLQILRCVEEKEKDDYYIVMEE